MIQARSLGCQSRLQVSAGLGARAGLHGMSESYGDVTASRPWPRSNEEWLGRAVRDARERLVIATKFGISRGGAFLGIDRRPDSVRPVCGASLLGPEVIDPLPPAPRRSCDADRGHDRGRGARRDREGPPHRIIRSVVRHRSARPRGASHHCTAEYFLSGRDPEPEILITVRNAEVAVLPIVHSAGAFSPADSRVSRTRIR